MWLQFLKDIVENWNFRMNFGDKPRKEIDIVYTVNQDYYSIGKETKGEPHEYEKTFCIHLRNNKMIFNRTEYYHHKEDGLITREEIWNKVAENLIKQTMMSGFFNDILAIEGLYKRQSLLTNPTD